MTTNWTDLAKAGAQEEATLNAAQKLKDRITNCNRPFYWYDPIQKKVRCTLPTCKHFTCTHCNTVRAGEEQARIERALSEHQIVHVLFDVPEKQWPKLTRKFKSHSITKNMYRRLPQDCHKLVVFFVGPMSLARELKAKGLYSLYDVNTWSGEQWYEFARKREGKRTSGSLGQAQIDHGLGAGPELTSVRIVSVRCNSINGAIHTSAVETANKATDDRNPHDLEDVESLIVEWSESYESFLRQRGHKTYRLNCWRKMDLTQLSNLSRVGSTEAKSEITAIQPDKNTIAVKSTSYSLELAKEHLWPRETAEI